MPSPPAPLAAARSSAAAPTLLVTGGAFFMVVLDATIVNVALPTLERSLDASLQSLQWIVDAYMLLFAACLLTGGAIADGFGARRAFATGIAVFSLASLACGLAPSTAVLIAARVAQGIGAALIVPAALALIRHAYHDPRERAHAIAVWAAAGGVGLAAGPLVGGVLVGTLGWRAIFLVNVLVGALALLATSMRLAPVPTERRRLDLGGQLTAIAAVGGLTFALIEGPALGWGAPAVLAALAAFVLGGLGFAACERHAPDPMLPPALVRQAHFPAVATAGLLLNLAFYGLLFVFSLYFQGVNGYSALETGLAFLPLTGLIAGANVVAPRLAARFGATRTIVAGQLVMAAGIAAALTLEAGDSALAAAVPLLPIGIGAGLSMPPLTSFALDAAAPALAGVAAGAFNASRQVGGAIGVALFGALLGTHAGVELMDGMHQSLLAALVATLAAAALTAKWVKAEAPRSGSGRV